MTPVEKAAFVMMLLAFLAIAVVVLMPSRDGDDIDDDDY